MLCTDLWRVGLQVAQSSEVIVIEPRGGHSKEVLLKEKGKNAVFRFLFFLIFLIVPASVWAECRDADFFSVDDDEIESFPVCFYSYDDFEYNMVSLDRLKEKLDRKNFYFLKTILYMVLDDDFNFSRYLDRYFKFSVEGAMAYSDLIAHVKKIGAEGSGVFFNISERFMAYVMMNYNPPLKGVVRYSPSEVAAFSDIIEMYIYREDYCAAVRVLDIAITYNPEAVELVRYVKPLNELNFDCK